MVLTRRQLQKAQVTHGPICRRKTSIWNLLQFQVSEVAKHYDKMSMALSEGSNLIVRASYDLVSHSCYAKLVNLIHTPQPAVFRYTGSNYPTATTQGKRKHIGKGEWPRPVQEFALAEERSTCFVENGSHTLKCVLSLCGETCLWFFWVVCVKILSAIEWQVRDALCSPQRGTFNLGGIPKSFAALWRHVSNHFYLYRRN